jgi:hypothetical protein
MDKVQKPSTLKKKVMLKCDIFIKFEVLPYIAGSISAEDDGSRVWLVTQRNDALPQATTQGVF